MRLLPAFGGRKRPRTLLSETSPYGSCHFLVETDPLVSAAYLLDRDGHVRSSLWLANHVSAPRQLDHERIHSGFLPPMPAGYTKHHSGRRPLRRRSLELVWFAEGDGAAIREDGSLLGVLRDWDGAGQRFPGYSREAVGRTPLAWSLDLALDTLSGQVARAREFWTWQSGKNTWGQYQRAVLSHLQQRLGNEGRYWSADAGRLPRVGVAEHLPTAQRPYAVYSTIGMSCQRQPLMTGQDASSSRIELALVTRRPVEASVDVLSWLGPYPWHQRSWLGPGHLAVWDTAREGFPLGARWEGVLLIADPSALAGPPAPDLSGLTGQGQQVRWLWLVPVTRDESDTARTAGSDSLLDDLKVRGREWAARL